MSQAHEKDDSQHTGYSGTRNTEDKRTAHPPRTRTADELPSELTSPDKTDTRVAGAPKPVAQPQGE